MLPKFSVRVALTAALIAAATGCAKASGPTAAPSPSASPTPPASSVLAAAVTKTAGTSLKLVLAGDSPDQNLTGVYDGKQGVASITQGAGAEKMTIVVTGTDLYLSGLGDFKGKTMRVQLNKLTAKSPFAVFADTLAPVTMLATATDVKATGPNAFAGTLDLTKAHGATVGAQKFLDHVLSAAAGRANAVAFTASTNEQGYLVAFNATLPNLDDGKDGVYDMKFSDFGSPVTVTKPTGSKVVDAPASLYS